MTKCDVIAQLLEYGFSPFKSVEIAIDYERKQKFAVEIVERVLRASKGEAK